MLFRALTGRRPFPRTTDARQPDHRPDFEALAGANPDLRALVAACLSVQPSDRPTIEEIRKVLDTSIEIVESSTA